MMLPIFPNLQSIGNGANSKKESKANAIIAFLAHMEKRKEVGLFVPYVVNLALLDTLADPRKASAIDRRVAVTGDCAFLSLSRSRLFSVIYT